MREREKSTVLVGSVCKDYAALKVFGKQECEQSEQHWQWTSW